MASRAEQQQLSAASSNNGSRPVDKALCKKVRDLRLDTWTWRAAPSYGIKGMAKELEVDCRAVRNALDDLGFDAYPRRYRHGDPRARLGPMPRHWHPFRIRGELVHPEGALLHLSDDALGVVFEGLRNTLDPRVALALSSANHELWALTQALRQQLRADHDAAAALCGKVGLRSCKELREAKHVNWRDKGLSAADLVLLSTLGSVLPALKTLILRETSGAAAGPDGVQRLAEGLGAGVTSFAIVGMHVGDAGASGLAAALGRGALPRLKFLSLCSAAIGDAGLVALAPALRLLPALDDLMLVDNPFGDEGVAALVASPWPLTKLKVLLLDFTQVADAGCFALAAALDGGTLAEAVDGEIGGPLPALERVSLEGTPAGAAAKAAVQEHFHH